jgi:hypothetical protein
MMESQKAEREEEKRARERIRQRINDDKVPLILNYLIFRSFDISFHLLF